MSSIKEKYKYLGKNTLIFAISSFSTKFLSFLLVPLYTWLFNGSNMFSDNIDEYSIG